MRSHSSRSSATGRRSWIGWSAAHIGAVACSALLLTLLWTAFPGTETLVAVNLPVVVLNATVSALIALAWAYRRTPYEDWRRRQWIRIGQWAAGILCAVEAVFTAFVLWAAYALASGDPWGNLRF